MIGTQEETSMKAHSTERCTPSCSGLWSSRAGQLLSLLGLKQTLAMMPYDDTIAAIQKEIDIDIEAIRGWCGNELRRFWFGRIPPPPPPPEPYWLEQWSLYRTNAIDFLRDLSTLRQFISHSALQNELDAFIQNLPVGGKTQ